MHHAGALVHHVAGFDQRDLVLVHELGPALHHDHDLKIADVIVPAGAIGGRQVRLDQMSDDLAVGGACDAKVAIEKEIAQAAALILGVARFDMAEEGGPWLLTHEMLPAPNGAMQH